jgi:hypothetical protein
MDFENSNNYLYFVSQSTFIIAPMDSQSEYIEDLRVIRKVMEESSRFLSLSGLSGLFAGMIALAGTAIAVFVFLKGRILITGDFFNDYTALEISSLKLKISLLAAIVLIAAIGLSSWLSYRKSIRKGLKIWTPVSKRFLANLLVPLVAGGILIVILYFRHDWSLILPAMLIFYGLALVSATKFTYSDIFYLGLIEVICGLAAAAFPSYAIILWATGFGLLHMVYGLLMYRKYER